MELKEKIDFIYEKIANKDLTFGCKIFHKVDWKRSFKARIITDKIEKDYGTFYWVKLEFENSITWLQEKEMEIIGNPVMLGDVLDWIYDNEMTLFEDTWINHIIDTTIKLWILNLRKPLEEQSDKCIDFIYNLILCTKNIKN